MLMLLIVLIVQLAESRSPDHVYRIKEEFPINHVIGYLNHDISKFRNGFSGQYRILNRRDKGVSCFSLEETSSKLKISSRVDREFLCGDSDSICYVLLKVSLGRTENLIVIKIEIEDINDNSPSWKMSKFKVEFNDGDNAGSRKSLPTAKDLDAAENGEIKYTLESNTNTFMLIQEHGLYLQTLKLLDRETKASYDLSIVAVDKGTIVRSAKLEVDVEILDVNDNTPRFSTSVFRPIKVIPETIPVGSVVLLLTATDADAGQNGEFSFYYSPTENSLAKSYFLLKPNGEITVQRPLDFDSGNHRFDFKVIVKDHASAGYERSSESRVEIAISDENDEYPTISVYNIDSNLKTGFVKIDENQPPLTTVAIVHTADKDFKESDAVTCTSKSYNKLESLNLTPTNENYEFRLVTARSFDREVEQRITVTIICSDTANHRKSFNVTLEIGDINDNAPVFSETVFHLYVKENMDPGTVVRNRITATDQDESNNRIIVYTIPATDQVPFSIEPRSAMIRTKEVLDRERQSQYQFTIVATDLGKPPQSSSTTIVIHIEDENDNPVIIDPFPNEFKVPENLPPNTAVGKVQAKDNDNQTIFYSLDHNADSTCFKIDKIGGFIMTKTQLDRETNQKFQFRVFVTDRIYTASILITIFVEDANDNSPKFKMPNATINSITASPSEAAGYKLTQIVAEDPDEKENSIIQYYITNSRVPNLFSLEKDSGNLYLESSLHSHRSDDRDFFLLDLEACDMGKKRRCTSFKGFKIYVQKVTSNPGHNGDQSLILNENGFSENVIVGLIGFLLIMILVIISVIILLRRRTKGNPTLRKEPHMIISSPGPYFQNQNGKPQLESDQCSSEICELTSRLSPDRDGLVPINQLAYYNGTDQYQGGGGIVMNGDHSYHVPLMGGNYQPQTLDPRAMQRLTDNLGYYSKYDMNDNIKYPNDGQTNFPSSDIKHSTISTITTPTVTTPLMKCKKLPANTIRKPQTSFV